MTYKPIESYGVIGDLHTVALVSMDGSIDWCCLPQFDSPSIFAAILDERQGGFAARLEQVDNGHPEQVQDCKHRPKSCDDSASRRDSQAG
jgi:GH15 family glucan-1,4-alpha-glucosidase